MMFIWKIFICLSLAAFVSCGEKVDEPLWNPNWGSGEDSTQIEKPDTTDTPVPPVAGKEGKSRLVWIDAAANFKDYADSEDNIRKDM